MDEAIGGLIAILDAEGVDKVNVIGSSMGGYMAQYFLKKYPQHLEKVVFGNTFPPNHIYSAENGRIRKALPFIPEWVIMKIFRKSLLKNIVPHSENSPLVEACLLEQYYGQMSKKQFIGRLDIVLRYFEPEFSEEHKNIPKLIIESDNDPLIKPVLRQKLKELYPDAEIFTFHNKGHFPYLNRPEKYTEILKNFFNDAATTEITGLLHNYFKARKNGDVDLLRKTFHPQSQLSTTDGNGRKIIIPLEEYFTIVKKQGPAVCQTKILSISPKGTKATARTVFDYGDKVYEDSLTLLKVDGQWWIMDKIFVEAAGRPGNPARK